ncbi:type II secretion system F family protein [Curtobacterium sp. 9128]|uniref:type II secretion system F family protein n=1 Tax=Curtobacterium sp. 9128 TaxID=1793722 RepID=UPI0011A6B0DE|nr:type II secretion system F family protein [Curtobacterium sp. 9128]
MSAPADGETLHLARLLDRVAVLVASGVPPPRAWTLAGPVPRGPAREDVAVVVAVARQTGAPVAPTLHALAAAVRRTAAADRAVRVALAGPRTSANVVLALPLLGAGLGATWGVDSVEVLTSSPIGWACCAAAALLVAVGRVWTRRLVDAASPSGRIPGVLLDAWAVALSGGGSWSGAAEVVRGATDGRPAAEIEGDRLREVLDLARRAGVPAATLLRHAAEDLRDDVAAEALATAERLGVRLVVPLGMCVLPAFVLIGVVPVVVGILSSTVPGVP